MNFCAKIAIIAIFLCFLSVTAFAQTLPNNNIPNIVKKFVDNTNKDDKIIISYIMKWEGYKVYRLRKLKYGINFGTPCYILQKGKNIRFPNFEEYQILCLDAYKHYNKIAKQNIFYIDKKQKKNINKVLQKESEFTTQNIPSAVVEYADKYMFKNKKDRHFLYLNKWQGWHIYVVYWKRYGFHLNNRSCIILFDGFTIRRPNIDEFNDMKMFLNQSYTMYLIEQGRLHNKD